MICYPVYRTSRLVIRKRYYCSEACGTPGEATVELYRIEEEKKFILCRIDWVQEQWKKSFKSVSFKLPRPKS
jgi:hypothetical protein